MDQFPELRGGGERRLDQTLLVSFLTAMTKHLVEAIMKEKFYFGTWFQKAWWQEWLHLWPGGHGVVHWCRRGSRETDWNKKWAKSSEMHPVLAGFMC